MKPNRFTTMPRTLLLFLFAIPVLAQVAPPPPTISVLSPSSVTAGSASFTVSVTGTNLAGATVRWNDGQVITPLATTPVSATQLDATVSDYLVAAVGTATIDVVLGNSPPSNALTFTINPVALTLTPASRTAGSLDFTLTVNGSNFMMAGGDLGPTPPTIYFGDTPLPSAFVSGTQLTVLVPANLITTPGVVDVSVANFGFSILGTTQFTILNPPSVTATVPTSRTAGSGAFALQVSGADFVSGATVVWDGGALTTTFNSATQLTAAAPANAITVGTHAIWVVSPDGVVSNSLLFTVAAAPTISTLNPTSRTAGAPGAFTLTVNGADFTSAMAVQWNGANLATTFVNATQLTASVPANLAASPGTANIRVQTADLVLSNLGAFTIDPPPAITSLSPSSVTAGHAGFTLTVLGTNFTQGASVRWNGVPQSPVAGAAGLNVNIPASLVATPGTANVTVATLDGAVSSAATFTIAGAPSVTSLNPASVAAGSSSFNLIVNGSNFVNGATVLFSGAQLATTFISVTQLSAAVPASLIANAGSVTVAVRSPDGAQSAAASYTIYNPPLVITNTMLPAGTVATAYSGAVAVTGGTGNYTWTLISGSLPPGLGPLRLGQINGTPTAPGTYKFVVQVSDAGDSTLPPVSQEYNLLINPARLTITTPSLLPDTRVGKVDLSFTVTGGKPPYTWAVTAGTVPPGLSLTTAGALTGTATTAGSYLFSVTATDSAQGTGTQPFRITILPAVFTVTTTSLPPATVQAAYSVTLSATGGTPPYTWEVTGLPSGLTADAATGTIGGKVAAPGNFTLGLKATDSAGATAAGSVVLTASASTLTINSAALPGAVAGEAYSATLSASGGVPPYAWSLAGNGPAGFSITGDGRLTGTPAAAGSLSFTVKVADAAGSSASAVKELKVSAATLTITTATLPGGTAGMSYTQALAATGGVPPLTWTATLPAGLKIDANTGVISGAVQSAGNMTLAVTVADAAGSKDSKSYSVLFALPTAPGLNLGGVPGTAAPLAQPAIQFGLTGAYPLPVTGTVTLTFKADTGPDDPSIVFSNGGRAATYTVPAGSTTATFNPAGLALQAGTTSGVITLTWSMQSGGQDITPSPAPTKQIRIPAAVPSVTNVVAARTSNGFTVQVFGYSTTREITQARFTLTGTNLGVTDFTVNTTSLFSAWFQSSASAQFGTQFLYTQPFTVTGDPNSIVSVAVSLTNSQGTTQPVTATLK